jgi:hypothetical protein
MKHLIILAALLIAGAAQAQQFDDIGAIKLDRGMTLYLNAQPCVNVGFMWWHIESAQGKTIRTGCWTPSGDHRAVLITDGKGNMWKVPLKEVK